MEASSDNRKPLAMKEGSRRQICKRDETLKVIDGRKVALKTPPCGVARGPVGS